MSDEAFQILLDGPDVHEYAERIRAWFEAERDRQPGLASHLALPPDGNCRVEITDGVALASLILNVPCAWLACQQLGERLAKKGQVERLLAFLKELTEREFELSIRIGFRNRSLPVVDVRSDELLDSASKEQP